MKNIFKTILMMAVLPFMALSCAPEEVFNPGEPDLEGCYGVYFPTQDASGSHAIDPSAPKTVEFVVKRLVKDDEITVPVEVTASEEGIFEVSELTFADGQTESKITVTFENAKPGVNYSLSLGISDPEYAHVYGSNPNFINYSVIIERYDLLGKALYREDLLTALFNVPNLEWEVEVYTKETQPGVYFLKNVYQPGICPLIDDKDENGNPLPVETTYMEIDASNPAKVLFPFQYLGLVINPQYGECAAASLAPEAGFNVTEGVYGTLSANIIEFPAKGLLFGMEKYDDFGFYYANPSAMFRVALPGAVLTDYTISMKAGFASQGQQPIAFTFGADVAEIKFMAYEGVLNAGAIAEKVKEVKKSETASVVTRPAADEEGNVPAAVAAVTLPATGEYTVVAVGYDAAGEAQSDASLIITYVAANDEVPVLVKGGISSADKYVPLGLSPETAVEFYLYGQDLVDVKVGLFSAADLADVQACLAAVQASESVSAEILETINTEVYVDVFTGLTPGTEYRMIVWASNGYEQEAILTDPWTTAGDPLPVYASYSAADINPELLPSKSDGYFGTYNYYALYDKPLREYFGQVTIQDSEYPDQGPDENGLMDEYVEVKGLFGGIEKQFAIKDDTMIFDYYNGVLYALENPLGAASHPEIGNFYVKMSMGNTAGSIFIGYDFLMIGGYVQEGYIAFVTAPNYASAYTIDTFYLFAYGDAEYTSKLGYLDYISQPLLVLPEHDDNGLAPSSTPQSVMSRRDLDKLQFNLGNEINYVETERGRIHSMIDRMHAEKKTPKMVGQMAGIKGDWDAPSVDVQVDQTSAVVEYNNDFTSIKNVKSAIYR